MNNPTNKLFTNVVSFAEIPGVIVNAADKLLSYILLKDNVAAWCVTHWATCGICRNGKRNCLRCCGVEPCVYGPRDC